VADLYRRKPSVVKAVQLRWTRWAWVCDFVGNQIGPHNPGYLVDVPHDDCGETGPYIGIDLLTAHDDYAHFVHGDWILKDARPGTFYPVLPDFFANNYEALPLPAEQQLINQGAIFPKGDGFNYTAVLSCGCTVRLNGDPHGAPLKVGDYTGCSKHSEIYEYDRETGHPDYQRDQIVVAAGMDEGSRGED